MRTLLTLTAVVSLLALLAGCGETYPDEEMHLGLQDRIRPLAVTCEPPEAAPGETVTVTLRYWAPRPAAVEPEWRVVLDYDRGMYEADETERRHVVLSGLPAPVADAEGFVTQTFAYTVPDSTLLWSSAIPEVLTDEAVVWCAQTVMGAAAGEPPRKSAVEAYLRGLDPAALAALAPAQLAVVQHLADLFACQIRLRATLADGMTVDVTRNLTVRHSRRVQSPNVNDNADITQFAIGSVPIADLDLTRLDEHEAEITWHAFDGVSAGGLPEARVTVESGHTYFARVQFTAQQYTSPYDTVRLLDESGEYRWYYFRPDAPGSEYQLLANEQGDETAMWELDDDVRLLPPGGESRYRLVVVVRDERSEWVRYHAVPGQTVTVGEVVFEAGI